jgi:hypothetical protein
MGLGVQGIEPERHGAKCVGVNDPGFKYLHVLILSKFKLELTRVILLGAAGEALLKVIRYTWINFIYPRILNSFTSSVTIRKKDFLLNAVVRYLEQRYMKKRAPRFISAISANTGIDNECKQTDETHDSECSIRYFPSVGSHWYL